jgi:uncharacterized membrane protein YoaK (UPF0700 family)
MALKIFKVLWVFSLLAVMALFMYVYASLPVTVIVNENSQPISVSKESLFYIALALIALTNAMVFAVTRVFPAEDADFKSWFYGLIIWINLFYVIGLNYISLYNSGEKYDYQRLGGVIYGIIAVVVIWVAAWPLYRIGQKILKKKQA